MWRERRKYFKNDLLNYHLRKKHDYLAFNLQWKLMIVLVTLYLSLSFSRSLSRSLSLSLSLTQPPLFASFARLIFSFLSHSPGNEVSFFGLQDTFDGGMRNSRPGNRSAEEGGSSLVPKCSGQREEGQISIFQKHWSATWFANKARWWMCFVWC